MTMTHLLRLLIFGGAALAVLSCDRTPVEVTSRGARPPHLSEATLEGTGLLRCAPLPEDSVAQTIGPEGGVLHVGPHRLSVPEGALSASVTVTAVAPSDSVNRIAFEPEGLTFERAASLTMSYANCDLLSSTLPKRIAYVSDALAILEYLLAFDDAASQTVTGRLEHFSGYAVAW